jgi:hypothetical protein
MIIKSTIAAMVFITMGVAAPAFAQVPPGHYDAYAYPYEQQVPYGWYDQQVPYGWAPYSYGGWPPERPGSIANNIHTPPNH